MKKINYFNILVFITMILSGGLLIHDTFIFAIKPLFTGDFVCLTYFGFFLDMIGFFMLEVSTQYVKEWFK